MALHELDRCRVKSTRAGVIAQPAPQGEDLIHLGSCERLDRREALDEALEVRDHSLDSGLLQHRLADPNRVCVQSVPPRQVTLMERVPRQESPSQGLSALDRHSLLGLRHVHAILRS